MKIKKRMFSLLLSLIMTLCSFTVFAGELDTDHVKEISNIIIETGVTDDGIEYEVREIISQRNVGLARILMEIYTEVEVTYFDIGSTNYIPPFYKFETQYVGSTKFSGHLTQYKYRYTIEPGNKINCVAGYKGKLQGNS